LYILIFKGRKRERKKKKKKKEKIVNDERQRIIKNMWSFVLNSIGSFARKNP